MTAKQLAETAARIAKGADALTPQHDDPCVSHLNLAVYHLRNAARITREVAEFQAKAENPKP